MKILGVHFAPISVPKERRLQTLAVVIWCCIFFWTVPMTILILYNLLFHSNYLWPFALIYIAWYFYDLDVCNKGGRRKEWFRNATLWKYCANYFPVKLIKTAELDPNKGNYLLGSHPHGMIGLGAFMSFGTNGAGWPKIFPNLIPSLVTLRAFHLGPGFREIGRSLGVSAATSRNIDYLFENHKNGQAVVIIIGGAREVFCQDRNCIELVLKNRKGFVKKALKHGSDLVPTFSFGEHSVFSNPFPNPKGSFLRNLQEKILDKTGWPFPFFMGRGIFQYSFGVMPKRIPITVVVGKPISVLKSEDPTQEQIDSMHETYIQALKELYEEYNPIYGNPSVHLKFI